MSVLTTAQLRSSRRSAKRRRQQSQQIQQQQQRPTVNNEGRQDQRQGQVQDKGEVENQVRGGRWWVWLRQPAVTV